MKRTLCKQCDTILLPGSTAAVRVKRRSHCNRPACRADNALQHRAATDRSLQAHASVAMLAVAYPPLLCCHQTGRQLSRPVHPLQRTPHLRRPSLVLPSHCRKRWTSILPQRRCPRLEEEGGHVIIVGDPFPAFRRFSRGQVTSYSEEASCSSLRHLKPCITLSNCDRVEPVTT